MNFRLTDKLRDLSFFHSVEIYVGQKGGRCLVPSDTLTGKQYMQILSYMNNVEQIVIAKWRCFYDSL